jgi:hypothetical protein
MVNAGETVLSNGIRGKPSPGPAQQKKLQDERRSIVEQETPLGDTPQLIRMALIGFRDGESRQVTRAAMGTEPGT